MADQVEEKKPSGAKKKPSNFRPKKAPFAAPNVNGGELAVISTAKEEFDEHDDEERCVVCVEKLEECSLGECGHRRSCGLCTFRLRTLHKDTKCVLCKMKLERVFIVKLNDARSHEDLTKLTWGRSGTGLVIDEKTDIFYTEECLPFKEKMDALREARCGECTEKFPNVGKLEKHLMEAHGKQLCKLCLEHRGLFLMEHQRMTAAELAAHYKPGDGLKSFEGHPACKFCKNMNFYNADGLYKHLNEAHESCHLCAKQGSKYQYFRDYKSLEAHFEQAHFLCSDPRCLESKFVAFLSELQLQAHIASEHPERTEARSNPLPLDFVYRGSRRAQHLEDVYVPPSLPTASGAGGPAEDFPRLGGMIGPPRQPSPYQSFSSTSNGASSNGVPKGFGELTSEESFPRLGGSSGSSNTYTGSQVPQTRYAKTASKNLNQASSNPNREQKRYSSTASGGVTRSSSLNKPFAALRVLADGEVTEREVKEWCDRVRQREISVEDFYDYMFNLLGEIALNAIFEDIQKAIGDPCAEQLETIRFSKSLASRAQWDAPVASTRAKPQSSQSTLADVRPAPSFDSQAFPTLSSVATARPSTRMSRNEMRELAFKARPIPRQVIEPVGVKTVVKRRDDDDLDPKLQASRGGSKTKKVGKPNAKSDRQQAMDMALKFGS